METTNIKLVQPEHAVKTLKKMATLFGTSNESFDSIYEQDMRPIIESPFMFTTYHWVTNIKEQRLTYVSGVQRHLGYADDTFTFQKSVQMIHPSYQAFVVEYGLMAYEMLTERRWRPLSSRSHYCLQFPVQCNDKKYLLVQMNASVIQTDTVGNPIANYNRFEILGRFLDVPIIIRPHVYFRANNDLSDLAHEAEHELAVRVRAILLKKLKITNRELLILQDFSRGNLRGVEIAELQNISHDAVKSFSKNILEKARTNLCPAFNNVRDVAIYLKNIDII